MILTVYLSLVQKQPKAGPFAIKMRMIATNDVFHPSYVSTQVSQSCLLRSE